MPAHLSIATTEGSADSAHTLTPTGIVVADEHAVVRRGIRSLLCDEDDLKLLAEASDVLTLAREVHEHAPRVLVIDLRLSGGSSLSLIRQLRADVPGMEIVVLTMERSPLLAQLALTAGAAAFVLKDRATEELVRAIRCAARGEEFISNAVATGLEALQAASGGTGLSARETQVLRLVALGHTSAETAAKLRLSRRTVETHRARICKKLGLRTRAELVQFALREGLLSS